MALVGGDVGVDRRGDESARLGGDDEGLRPWPLLWFPQGSLSLQLDSQLFSLETETEQRGSASWVSPETWSPDWSLPVSSPTRPARCTHQDETGPKAQPTVSSRQIQACNLHLRACLSVSGLGNHRSYISFFKKKEKKEREERKESCQNLEIILRSKLGFQAIAPNRGCDVCNRGRVQLGRAQISTAWTGSTTLAGYLRLCISRAHLHLFKKKRLHLFFLMCTHMSVRVSATCVWVPKEFRRGGGEAPGAGVASVVPGTKLVSVEEQPAQLTTEPSFQPPSSRWLWKQ